MNDNASSWITVGLGRSTIYQYSNLTLDVSAGGTFTLTSAQAANKLLTFTGNPSAGVIVVVPAIVSICPNNKVAWVNTVFIVTSMSDNFSFRNYTKNLTPLSRKMLCLKMKLNG